MLALTLIASSCTTELSSDPAPTLTTTTTATTVAPATTVTPSTAPATAPELTTTTLRATPTDAVVAILVGGADHAGWLFLGAWQRDRWRTASDPAGNAIRREISPGADATVSRLSGARAATVGDSAETCDDGRVGPTLSVTVAAPAPPGFGYSAVAAIDSDWPVLPRPFAATSTAPASYRALGERAFDGVAVDASLGDIEQLVVVDLDGDGDDEAVASFEYVQSEATVGTPGDLAALLLVDVNTRAATTVATSSIASTRSTRGLSAIARYRVLAVADLNGDGRMEVVVHTWIGEVASVKAYAYDGTELNEVLAAGCDS